MCGILGIINNNQVSVQEFEIMLEELKKRGPDNFSIEILNNENTILGHTRLSILDLSSLANQPMKDVSGRYWITYNGEIYNFKKIKEKLEKIGYTFITNADTEVVLYGFIEWGPKITEIIDGIFSFGIWDNLEKTLFLVRDPIGVKPLYYGEVANQFIFSSQLKPIYKLPNFQIEVSFEALAEYMSVGYIGKEKSILKNFNKLKPGHYLIYNQNKIKIEKYWEIIFKPEIFSFKEAVEEVDFTLNEIIKEQLISDVPVGLFLSGGIDSGLIASYASKNDSGNLASLTLGFEGKQNDERSEAIQLSKKVNLKNYNFILTKKIGLCAIEDFYKVLDEPFFDLSVIPTTYISEIASNSGFKVILAGDGGDELFAGYPRYLNPFYDTSGRKNKIIKFLKNSFISSKKIEINDQYINRMTFFSNDEISKLINFEFNIKPNAILLDNLKLSLSPPTNFQLLDFETYLPDDLLAKVDRSSMYHGVEVRVPFLDKKMVNLAFKIDPNLHLYQGKLKAILNEIANSKFKLDKNSSKKRGFSIPLNNWLKEPELKHLIFELENGTLFNLGILNIDYFKHIKSSLSINQLWILVSLELWSKKYLKN